MQSVPAAALTPADPPGIRTRMTVPVLAFGGTLMAVMQTVVVPLLPDLPRLTGASASSVSWMVTATLLTGAVLTPVLGRAGDMYGKRRVLLMALAMMTAGSVMCALTSDIRVLIAARAMQGAAAAVIPLSISILRDVLPPARTGSAVALMSATVGFGAALGLPLAALLVQYTNWHVMFWVNSGLGAFGIALVWWAVRETAERSPGRFDILGTLGLTTALVCLLLAVSQGGQWGWGSTRTLGLFCGSVVAFTLWCHQQLRTRWPLVDLRLAARPGVALPHLAALLAGFAFYANTLSTAQLVQAPKETGYGLGLSIVGSGLCLLPAGIIMLLFSPVSARISAARGARVTLALGAVVIALGYVVRVVDSRSLWAIVGGASVVSIGTTLCYSALPTLILRVVPSDQTASANGVNVLMRTIGQSVCSAAVAAVLVHHMRPVGGLPVPTLHGYLLTFAMAGTVALVACGAALAIPAESAKPTAPGTPGSPARSRSAGSSGPAQETARARRDTASGDRRAPAETHGKRALKGAR